MTDRILLAILALVALLGAGAIFLFMSILPIVIGGGVLLCLLCAGVLALGTGILDRWVEIVDLPEARRQDHLPHAR